MDRAGRAVAWRVRRVLGGTYGRRIVVLCGPGNNGGDGRIAAAALRSWGARVDVVDLSEPVTDGTRRAIARADAVVDAMFGTGLRDALSGPAAGLTELINRESGPTVIAVDIPSGVDGLTGETHGCAVRADHTVTFAALKPGLWFHPGRAHAGTVTVADVGIDLDVAAARTGVTEGSDVARWVPARAPTTHKWRAAVLVVGGSDGMTGAPMLAAHAAMRLGAGIVWAALPGRAAERASGTEVITRALPDSETGRLTLDGAVAAAQMLAGDNARFGAVVLGPGLGRAPDTMHAVRALVTAAPVPLVLDADGIGALAGAFDVLRARPAPTILTPHDGEYTQLTGSPPGVDRIDAARTLARDADAVVLLKGPTTVVAAPDGRVALNPTGGPALATAGSGDVLSGMIAAFAAFGMNPFEAGAAAALVHGRAAQPGGHTGLIAGDLPVAAAAALRAIIDHPAQEA